MHARMLVTTLLLAAATPLGAVPRPWPLTSRREAQTAATCREFVEAHPVESECCGRYSPTCDDGGGYSPYQCHGSTGYCWCVDAENNRLGEQARSWEDSSMTEEGCAAVRLAHEEEASQPRLQQDDKEPMEEQQNPTRKRSRGSMLESALFVFFFAVAAGCMWVQWTSGRGQSLAGKEFEMDATSKQH